MSARDRVYGHACAHVYGHFCAHVDGHACDYDYGRACGHDYGHACAHFDGRAYDHAHGHACDRAYDLHDHLRHYPHYVHVSVRANVRVNAHGHGRDLRRLSGSVRHPNARF